MSNREEQRDWIIVAHPQFLDQLENLIEKVEQLREKQPEQYKRKNATKRLYAILRLILHDIPQDPTRTEYRQGKTLGDKRKHWFRAKFYQQYRLFFRYSLEEKIIVLGWVNDEKTKRAYGSKTDAYRIFEQMLSRGHPPDDWDQLLKEAQTISKQFDNLINQDEYDM